LKAHQANCFVCSVCKLEYLNAEDYAKHLKIHAWDQPFGCGGCEKSFAKVRSVLIHMKNHDQKQFFRLLTTVNLKYHIKLHFEK